MSQAVFLSMAKAIDYLGDVSNAQQLLGTLESTLETEVPRIASAIETQNFAHLQKIWHQLKGFAPVFCHDQLVAEIAQTETLCKHIQVQEAQSAALKASAQLLTHLQGLLTEVKAQRAS
jgi:HPt (histidine-containing phosphotransfer) domain-containing protein